jgi:hypothetical protein
MLQLDGSYHDWLEGRGNKLCLIGAIDDATNYVPGGLFREREDAHGYFLMMRQVVRRCGIPETVYHDQHGIFMRDPKEQETVEEQLEGRRAPTQFGRLMEELDVRQIPASSPQAKGRVERLWGTFQDRLVSELRLAEASTIQEANEVLKRVIADHNQRFHRQPGDPQSAYRKPHKSLNLDNVFCFKYKRVVAKDNTVTFFSTIIQIEPGPDRRSYAGCRVDLHECFDGSFKVFYKDTCLAKTNPPATPPTVVRVRRTNGRYTEECPWTPSAESESQQPPATPESSTKAPWKPAANHPWRKAWVTKSQTNRG